MSREDGIYFIYNVLESNGGTEESVNPEDN